MLLIVATTEREVEDSTKTCITNNKTKVGVVSEVSSCRFLVKTLGCSL